jgi:FlaA1/EpsC-like NDP-sugar epimerase
VRASLRALLTLPRAGRTFLVILSDLCLCHLVVWIAFWLRLGDWQFTARSVIIFTLFATGAWIVSAAATKSYKALVRYSGRETIIGLLKACALMSAVLVVVLFAARIEGIPRTLAVLHPLLFFFVLTGARIGIASLFARAAQEPSDGRASKRVLIYGADIAGQQLASSIRQELQLDLMGFMDPDHALTHRSLDGKEIWHDNDLEDVLIAQDIDEVFVALPSATRSVRRQIVERIRQAAPAVGVKILPSLSEIAFDRVSINDLREVQI